MRSRTVVALSLLSLVLVASDVRAWPGARHQDGGSGGAPNDSSDFDLGDFIKDLWNALTGKNKNKGGGTPPDSGGGSTTGGSTGGSGSTGGTGSTGGSGTVGGAIGGITGGGSTGGGSTGGGYTGGGSMGGGGTGGTGGAGGSGGSGGAGGSGGTAMGGGTGGSGSNGAPGNGTPPPAAPPLPHSPPPLPPTDVGGMASSGEQPRLFASAGPQGQIIGGSDNFKGVLGGSNSDPAAEAKAAAEAAAAQREAENKFYSQRADVGAVERNPAAESPEAVKASAFTRSAKTKMDMGDYAEAIRDASEALKLAPGAAGALSIRATAYNMTGRYKEAIADIKEALKTRPNDSALWENLAWANLRTGDYAGAIKAADRAIQLNPKSALALATRGYAKQMTGDMKGLAADLEAAAALDSRFAEQARLAREGKRVYDPEGDDASYLLGAAAAVAHAARGVGFGGGAAVPVAVGGISMLVLGAGAIGFFAARRRRTEPERKPVARLAPLAPEAARPDAGKGGLLAGKYRLEGVIGRGGMGEVRRAKDSTLGRPVAIKTLSSALSVGEAGEEWRARLRQEAMTVAGVHHPGIVDIYEIVEAEGALHLVFEYIEGTTVASMLAQKGRLSPAECARLLAPVCDALEYAHGRGLVHRDLKPGNIMVTSTNHVKLLDFGIARAQGDKVPATAGALAAAAPGLRFDRTTTVAGTPVYMPPEADQGLVGPPGDVYALGVCLYEMLTGRRPYPDNASTVEKAALTVTPASAYGGVPPAFDALIAAAMSADPAARPAGPAAFKAALEAASK